MQNKRIFTFWEPADKLPEYLQLCMMTWKKFLPEYEIVILDYKNLDNWLGKNYFDKTLYEKFSLPKQADAIRCAILKKYGGIWFDVDTIVTSEDISQLFDIASPPELTLVGKRIPVIFAKQNARILVKWENGIKKHIEIVKQNTNNIFNKIKLLFFNYKLFKKIRKWDYLGDAILKSLLANQPKEILYSINFKKNKIYPEKNWAKEKGIIARPEEEYRKFYFEGNYDEYALKDTKGLICLHNSWTPKKYKEMNKEEFLKQNNTLANVLNKLLEEVL